MYSRIYSTSLRQNGLDLCICVLILFLRLCFFCWYIFTIAVVVVHVSEKMKVVEEYLVSNQPVDLLQMTRYEWSYLILDRNR